MLESYKILSFIVTLRSKLERAVTWSGGLGMGVKMGKKFAIKRTKIFSLYKTNVNELWNANQIELSCSATHNKRDFSWEKAERSSMDAQQTDEVIINQPRHETEFCRIRGKQPCYQTGSTPNANGSRDQLFGQLIKFWQIMWRYPGSRLHIPGERLNHKKYQATREIHFYFLPLHIYLSFSIINLVKLFLVCERFSSQCRGKKYGIFWLRFVSESGVML